MLKSDGTYIIYIVQCQRKGDKSDKWYDVVNRQSFLPSLSYDSVYLDFYNSKLHERFIPFSSLGKCWQETYIYGTFKLDEAVELEKFLFNQLNLKENYNFRILKLGIAQRTEIV